MPYDPKYGQKLKDSYRDYKLNQVREVEKFTGVDLSAVTPSGDESSLKAKIKAVAADPNLAKFLPNKFLGPSGTYLNKFGQVIKPMLVPGKTIAQAAVDYSDEYESSPTKWKPGKVIPFENKYKPPYISKPYVPTPEPEPSVQMVKQVHGRRFREDD